MEITLYTCEGFDWDEGNSDKNWYLHQVTNAECEEIFFNVPLIIAPDTKHSQSEPRYYTLGHTNARRGLFAAFTVRNNRVRIISARDMNQREVKRYARTLRNTDEL